MKSKPVLRRRNTAILILVCLLFASLTSFTRAGSSITADELTYAIVDTGQTGCYDDIQIIDCPQEQEAYYGQDAQYDGIPPGYVDNGDGTVTDLNTGLMWQQTPDFENRLSYDDALAGAGTSDLAGYDDWRLPSVKELYSLINFNGSTGTTITNAVPYIDTNYFDFEYGDESEGYRYIDAQIWSSTEYVGLTYDGDATVFGVNFADGRIKGYPREEGRVGTIDTHFVRYVRDNPDYGINNYTDNGDGTITDLATGLMWQTGDSGTTMIWQDALAYAESLELAGYDDWRLPNAKELQSIVDYTRAPDAQDPAHQGAAIEPIFDVTEIESWYWTSTTHLDGTSPEKAVYLTFGLATGVYNGALINVHGAGAQRSDPKSGDPADYVDGFGPQNDEIRIFNYARAVRNLEPTTEPPATPTSTPSPPPPGPGPIPTSTPTPTTTPTTEPSECAAYDLTNDGVIDLDDINAVLLNSLFVDASYDPVYDFFPDGVIDIADIFEMSMHFGQSCPSTSAGQHNMHDNQRAHAEKTRK